MEYIAYIFGGLFLAIILILAIPIVILLIALANKKRFVNFLVPITNNVTREQAHRLLAPHIPQETLAQQQGMVLSPEGDAPNAQLVVRETDTLVASTETVALSSNDQMELRGLVARTVKPDPWEEFYRVRIRNPHSNSTDLAKQLINRAAFNNAFLGFVTGLPAFAGTAVLAPVDALATGRIKAVMVQSIAYAYDIYDEDEDIVKKRTFMIMLGGSQVTQYSTTVITRYVFGIVRRSVFRGLPLVGSFIGCTVNFILTQAAGRAAIQYYIKAQQQRLNSHVVADVATQNLPQPAPAQLVANVEQITIPHQNESIEQSNRQPNDRRLVQTVQTALERHGLEDVLFNLDGHIDLEVNAEFLGSDTATQARNLVALCRSNKQRTALIMSLRDFEDDLLGQTDQEEVWLTWARERDAQ